MKPKGSISNDGWKVASIKKTGALVPYQPLKKQVKPTGSVVVASFLSEDDMLRYVQMKKLGLEADAIAYMLKEHEYLGTPKERLQQALIDLEDSVAQVKKESARECFGNCQSMEQRTACSICFRDLHQTWDLCATIKAIDSVCSENTNAVQAAKKPDNSAE